MAAPVLDRAGKLVAILGVQGPAVRFSPRAMRSAAELLTERAALISAGRLPRLVIAIRQWRCENDASLAG